MSFCLSTSVTDRGDRVDVSGGLTTTINSSQQATSASTYLPTTDFLNDRSDTIKKLSNLLKLPKAQRWICCEWFYSDIDK